MIPHFMILLGLEYMDTLPDWLLPLSRSLSSLFHVHITTTIVTYDVRSVMSKTSPLLLSWCVDVFK